MFCWAVLLQDTFDSALKSTGVDVNSLSKTTTAVTQTANEGVSVAKPFLSQAITFLTTTEPVSSCVLQRHQGEHIALVWQQRWQCVPRVCLATRSFYCLRQPCNSDTLLPRQLLGMCRPSHECSLMSACHITS